MVEISDELRLDHILSVLEKAKWSYILLKLRLLLGNIFVEIPHLTKQGIKKIEQLLGVKQQYKIYAHLDISAFIDLADNKTHFKRVAEILFELVPIVARLLSIVTIFV